MIKIPKNKLKKAELDVIKELGLDNQGKIQQMRPRSDSHSMVESLARSSVVSTFLKQINNETTTVLKSKDDSMVKKEPTAEAKSIIARLFKLYQVKKSKVDQAQDLTKFYFCLEEFVIQNEKVPNYLDEDDSKWVTKDEDFWLKTDCFLLTDTEVKGELRIKRDNLLFKTKTSLGMANLGKLQKIDDELFEKEIKQIEEH